MTVLDTSQVAQKLRGVAKWQIDGMNIVRDFTFADFVEAMKFVNQVAEEAEKAGHHPDIDIRWNKVRLALSSHDAGGLTDDDFRLAAVIDKFA